MNAAVTNVPWFKVYVVAGTYDVICKPVTAQETITLKLYVFCITEPGKFKELTVKTYECVP